jgi:hypothetical protein
MWKFSIPVRITPFQFPLDLSQCTFRTTAQAHLLSGMCVLPISMNDLQPRSFNVRGPNCISAEALLRRPHLERILKHTVTCESDYRRGFGRDIGFVDHFNTNS